MLTYRKGALPQRALAIVLTAAMLCPPGGLLAAAQAQQVAPPVSQEAPAPPAPTPPAGSAIRIPMAPTVVPIHSILLFPFASNLPASNGDSGFNADQVGARIEDAVKLRLNVIGRYKGNSFSPTLPQVQRALQEARVEGLSENDLQPPYNDAQKAQKIAAQVGTDGYLLGTIEALRSDPASRNVTLTVGATLYNSASGATARGLAFTGKGVSFNPNDDPDNLLQSAINDVAGQIVSALNGSLPQERLTSGDSARGHHNKDGGILLGILLAAAVGIAIGSSHHGSSNNSSSTTTTTTTSSGPPSPPGISTTTSSSPPNPPSP